MKQKKNKHNAINSQKHLHKKVNSYAKTVQTQFKKNK